MGIISNGFDYFGYHEIPTFVLCNPDKTPLYALMGIKDRKLDLKLNALSTLTFTAFPIVNGNEMAYYDLLKSKRLILIDDVGYFLITEVEEKNDGIERYKTITANSLEAELIFRKINLTSGQYKIYNIIPDPDTPDLLHQIFDEIPGWTVGEVDIDLMDKYRTFEINDITVYNFLMSTVSESIEGVFIFDTFNKTVNLYSVDNVGNSTDIIKPSTIYLSHDNLMLETTVKDLTDELFTAMYVKGGGNLGISKINPLGTNYIYDFSYYKNLNWMSQNLITALTTWENLPNETVYFIDATSAENNYTIQDYTYATCHADLWNLYYTKTQQLYGYDDDPDDTGLYGELDTLNQQLATLEIELAALIETRQGTSSKKTQILNKKNEIEAKEDEIEDIEDDIDAIIISLRKIADRLSIINTVNFSEQLQLELSPFIIETSYMNENFLQTDSMKENKVLEQSQKLYDQAVKVLDRISQPRYEFSISSLNLIFMQEFENFGNQLQLGSSIYAEMAPGVVHQPVLLQISLNYDDPQDFSMTFGNRLRLDSSEFVFADLFEKTISTSNTVSINSSTWNNWDNNYKSEVSAFIDSALDAGRNNIITSANQEFVISSAGLRGRKLLENSTTEYEPEEIWMNNNILAFTRDNWDSASLVLGKIYVDGVYKGYGLAADIILGKLLAGENLIITNEGANVTIDSQGMTLIDTALTILHSDSFGNITEETLEDTVSRLSNNDNFLTSIFAPEGGTTTGGRVSLINEHMMFCNNNVNIDENGLWLMDGTSPETSSRAVRITELGILLGRRETIGNSWANGDFDAAITADGIVADAIVGTKYLSANNESYIDFDAGTFSFGNGLLTWNGSLFNVTGNASFTGDLTLGGNINMTGNINWGNNSLAQSRYTKYENPTSSQIHSTFQTGDLYVSFSYDGGVTWTTWITIDASIELPGYITETYIDSAKIKSPKIYGNEVYAHAFTVNNLSNITGDLGNITYGTMGMDLGEDANGNPTNGISLMSSNRDIYVIVTTAGVRMQAGECSIYCTPDGGFYDNGTNIVEIGGGGGGTAVFG